MDKTIAGGCACGAVRYRTDAAPNVMLNCHCRDCQRASGSAFAAITVVPQASVAIEGTPRFHTVTADSGNAVERGFCPSCGSPLFVKLARLPEILGLAAGSLDDPARHQPSLDVFTDSAQAWCALSDATKKFPRAVTR